MGSNQTLGQICRHFGLDQFIMTDSLVRAKWLPTALVCSEVSCASIDDEGREKIYADVVESLLGLIYLEFGFKKAVAVGDELSLTLSQNKGLVSKARNTDIGINQKNDLLNFIKETTGYYGFTDSNILIEAFAHRTAENAATSSYERLEWIGDAVLCLVARDWIWKEFPDLELGHLVSMEGALVSNEVLAFLCVQLGLHKFLDHRDRTLPPRIEAYIRIIRDEACGLWGTDPPKCLADIVESVIGAIYMDGGLASGMAAALTILAPICEALSKWKDEGRYIDLAHPKKTMQELVGSLLLLSSTWEDNFATSTSARQVLEGNSWRPVDPYNSNAVGHVDMNHSTLVAVADASVSVARNRACGIIVALLRSNPALMEKLGDLRRRVESAITAQGKN